ncbi:MAG: PBP1A family penicillin-binding protein [Acidobacteriota bacterium]
MPKPIQVKSGKPKMPPKYWLNKRRGARVESFKQPPPSRFRRILRLIFNPITALSSLLILLCAFLTLTYFWFEYSDRIDLLLKGGDVFTRTAGIYSAPKTLKIGEDISLEDLTAYLKSAGYIEKNQQADNSRSRYKIEDNSIEIEPGATAVIDDKKIFPFVLVKFNKGGKEVDSITDEDANQEVKQVKLEPQILSSLAAEGDGRRKAVNFADLPPALVKAITVTEDRAFFEHYGVNFRGIARAAWRRYEGDDASPLANQGGSSITQQLVKNLFLTREQTLERKAKEAYMSLILETRLPKEEIFTLYANQIYLGQLNGVSIYGVGEAANAYFGKDVSQINLSEAAMIAGIIRSPNRYNPFKNTEKVTERRNQVLDSMVEAEAISADQASEARKVPLELRKISSQKDLQGMPYFSQFAVDEVPKVINDPEALQHLRVYTTIDPDLQKAAYEIVNKRLDRLDKYFPKKPKGSLQAALVSIRPKTGEIVAMVGGRDFLETQFNRATSAERQPGSVFKPFVYATALNTAYDANSRVITPATIFKDEKKVFTFGSDSYSPNNYGDHFSNQEMTLRDALVKSKNVITVDLGMELNIGKVMNLAAKAGMPKVEKAYPSMALGTAEATPLQVATAYTMFANLGDKVSPMAINRVTNGDGKTVVAPVAEKKNVLHADVAYIMDDIMKDVINRGTAAEAKAWGFKNVDGKTAFAGKTGTSRDGWFAGFTPEIVTVVYVGFDNGDDLGMKGSDSAMPIWADFMKEALSQNPDWNGDWQMPTTIQKAEIDTRTGKLIKDLSTPETDNVQAQQSVSPLTDDPNMPTLELPETKNIFVTEVPPEFRRIELFVAGTAPNKMLLPTTDDSYLTESELNQTAITPTPTATPFMSWEEAQQNQGSKKTTPVENYKPMPEIQRNITVMVCDLTGMRATKYCPHTHPKTFEEGEEPKEFCTFHVNPPR